MKSIFIFFSLLTFLTQSTLASVWPVFYIPDGVRLFNEGVLTTNDCPVGMVRLIKKTYVSVDRFCKTYCPESWKWNVSGNSKCFELSNTQVGNISIDHIRNKQGTTLYSVVQTTLSDSVNGDTNLNLNFVTPKENWFCILQNDALKAVTCANDV